MKYLKYFENNNILEDVKDICLELEDKGFIIEIQHLRYYEVHIGKNKRMYAPSTFMDGSIVYNYDEVRDVIDRLKQYLGNKITSSYISSILDNRLMWNNLNGYLSNWILNSVYSVKIEFKA